MTNHLCFFSCDNSYYTISFQVNQKMILTLTASIMSWFLKHPHEERTVVGTSDSESGSQLETTSNSTLDDSASDSSLDENGNM